MMYLSDNNKADFIEAFSSTLRYLDCLIWKFLISNGKSDISH